MQQLTQRTSPRITAVLLAVVAAFAAYQSFAYRPADPANAAPGQPTVVRVFDVEKTFNTILVKKKGEDDLLKLAEDLDVEAKELEKKIKQLKTELEDHQPGSQKYKQLLDQFEQETQTYSAYVEFCRAKIDVHRGRMFKGLYLEIRKYIDQIAAENGYDLVMVDETKAEMRDGTAEEIQREISARRMAYAGPQLDITETLIERMNSDFVKANPGFVPRDAPNKEAAKGPATPGAPVNPQ
jgi:Skp family chaperone for outer membrane proteins